MSSRTRETGPMVSLDVYVLESERNNRRRSGRETFPFPSLTGPVEARGLGRGPYFPTSTPVLPTLLSPSLPGITPGRPKGR